MKKIILLLFLFLSLSAKEITPNEVYSKVMIIQDRVYCLLKYYGVKHDHKGIIARNEVNVNLKPRSVWQKSYEVFIKLNMLRSAHGFPIVTPVNILPVLHLNPNLVYEQAERILTELDLFMFQLGIKCKPTIKVKNYRSKTSLDVYNAFGHVSASLDELNKNSVTSSYVFAENMRIYDDITLLLEALDIEDHTIPKKKNKSASYKENLNVGLKTLEKIKQLQIVAGVDFIDFTNYKRVDPDIGDVFSVTEMILAELQTLKAYLHIEAITPPAVHYDSKTQAEVYQLMSWNLRKLELIKSLIRSR